MVELLVLEAAEMKAVIRAVRAGAMHFLNIIGDRCELYAAHFERR